MSDHPPVGCFLRMAATTKVVDNSFPVVARPGALRDAANRHRHDDRVLVMLADRADFN